MMQSKKPNFRSIFQSNIRSIDIEQHIQNEGIYPRGHQINSWIEKVYSPPSFVKHYYQMIDIKKKPISDREFVQDYMNTHKKKIEQYVFPYAYPALEGRLYRAFPSLVRDHHNLTKLNESGLFQNVGYNLELDMYFGVDGIVKYNNRTYGFQWYLESERSKEFRNSKKNKKLEEKMNNDGTLDFYGMKIHYIEIPLTRSAARTLKTTGDDIYLYSDFHIQQMYQKVVQMNKELNKFMKKREEREREKENERETELVI